MKNKNETKHTPGPWALHMQTRRSAHEIVHDGGVFKLGWFIAASPAEGGDKLRNGEADGRLIAAAPGLYAALEIGLAVMETQYLGCAFNLRHHDECKPGCVVAVARAALAKARTP